MFSLGNSAWKRKLLTPDLLVYSFMYTLYLYMQLVFLYSCEDVHLLFKDLLAVFETA